MSGFNWEKSQVAEVISKKSSRRDRYKFLVGGSIILAAVIYLMISGTMSGAQYFITIDELLANPDYVGQRVRISGAVIGDTIVYDRQDAQLDFTVVHIPKDTKDLALTLHQAVNNPTAAQLQIHMQNHDKPDLLQHEAQAILSGILREDGVFYATELLLKCPSRYEEEMPNQVGDQEI